ncbi:hypothetical protein BN1708_005649 [Verticillium longisporum]|uniref:Uncharacterized protein n=1 Tax=Verticillium longisporum TaxID=100787 RepID=A0A0G4MCI6_VERLO|nr:hypothetical protein BN1708_005649 [Verticillium longisporum]
MFRVDVAAGRDSGTKSMSQSKLDRTKFSGPSRGRDHGGQRSKVLDGFFLKRTQNKGPQRKEPAGRVERAYRAFPHLAPCSGLVSAPVTKGRQLGFWVILLLGRDGNMLDCVVVADVWLRRLIPRRTTPPASRRGDMKRCLWKDESNEKPHALMEANVVEAVVEAVAKAIVEAVVKAVVEAEGPCAARQAKAKPGQ